MTNLIEERIDAALDWVELRKGDVVDVEDLVRGIVTMYMRPDIDVPAGYALKVVPLDDDDREFANSKLPIEMIDAGMDALERAQIDLKSESLDAIDWDNGMIAVAVYRAMTSAVPSSKPSGDAADMVEEIDAFVAKARSRLTDNPEKFLRKDAERLLALVETQVRIIETMGKEK